MARAGAPAGIGLLLAQAGISAAYLQGYLTALAIAPLQPSPQDWLGALLGGIEFPGEGVIDHLIGFLMMQANEADENAGDPEIVASALAALDENGLNDWSAGFNALVTATRSSWPAKHLRPDDKRILRDIERMAEGAEDDTLRNVLPSWVARRHDLRR